MSLKLVIIGIALLGFVASSLGEDAQPNSACPPNETLYDFVDPCRKDTCEKAIKNVGFYECGGYKTEHPVRNCVDNFYRNKEGHCVSIDQCRSEING
uniref:Protease inibitor PG10A8 n=1 Tax=Mayetiola destructor TaxID=39758 RepID=Q0QVU5_MAYDE|nr:protease inibitor PG10A8 [Mayetiola destructor]